MNHTHDATNFSLFVLLIPEYQTQPMTILVIDVFTPLNFTCQWCISTSNKSSGASLQPEPPQRHQSTGYHVTHDIQIECVNRIDNAAWIPTMLSSLASAYIQHFIGGHSTRKHALPYFVKWLSSQLYIYIRPRHLLCSRSCVSSLGLLLWFIIHRYTSPQ